MLSSFRPKQNVSRDAEQSLSLHNYFDAPLAKPATAKSIPTREPLPTPPDCPEFEFLEEKSRSGFEHWTKPFWLEGNSDFWFCVAHKQVREMMQLHPKESYRSDCNFCLSSGSPSSEPTVESLVRTFFPPEFTKIHTLEKAMEAWKAVCEDRMNARANGDVKMDQAESMRRDLRERSVWLRCLFLAWQRNKHRVRAVGENAARPGQSESFNQLPGTADLLLVEFANMAQMRFLETTAGQMGKSCNVQACLRHRRPDGEPAIGHAIQVLNKNRYEACGVCPKPRDSSRLDREVEKYNEKFGSALAQQAVSSSRMVIGKSNNNSSSSSSSMNVN